MEDERDEYGRYIHIFQENRTKPLKMIASFYKGNGLNLLGGSLFLFIHRTPCWAIPIITAEIINVATARPADGVRQILIYLLIVAFFIMLNVPGTYFMTRFFSKVNRRIENILRSVLIQKLQYLSILFHKAGKSGKLQSKIMRDVENIYELLNQIFRVLLLFVIDFTVIICVCIQKSPLVLLFFAFTAPISVLLLYVFNKPIKKKNRAYRMGMEETQGAVAQMLEMIPIARAHGLQKEEMHRMDSVLSQIRESGFRLDLTTSFFGSFNWALYQFIQMICLVFTAILALNGKISVGEVVLYQTFFGQLVGQLSTIINIYPAICKGVESLNSIGDVLVDEDEEPTHAIIPLGELKGNIEYQDICFQYPDGKAPVLNHFNLKIREGESVAFVGSSGGGKSTLLNLLIGFVTPKDGRILIDGINMANLDLEEYRSQIAIVPQTNILFDGSVKDNICYGLDRAVDEEVWEVLEEVGLKEFVETLPSGINTPLGEHGDKLSGGQKQRISIARALIRHPKIIIFDEATSALDNESERTVQNAIGKMMGKCTTLIVAHRLSTIRAVDRIAVIDGGTAVEIGSYDELMAKKGAFYQMQG